MAARLHTVALMEPRPFSHEYPYGNERFGRRRSLLQWSHDLSAMDTLDWAAIRPASSPLQWSHDLSAMDTLDWAGKRLCSIRPASSPLQWSHDLSAMDTLDWAGAIRPRQLPASMEP